MPITYTYDPEARIIHSRPAGEITVSDVCRYFEDLVKDDEIKIGSIEVGDFKDTTNFLFSSDEAPKIAEQYIKLKNSKKIHTTVLIGENDLQYGVARMMQIFNDIKDEDPTIFVVRTREEADKIIAEKSR